MNCKCAEAARKLVKGKTTLAIRWAAGSFVYAFIARLYSYVGALYMG